jgi:Amt family ammonium transporter
MSSSSSSSGNIFMDCAATQQQALYYESSDADSGNNVNTTAILQCVSDFHQEQTYDRETNLRSFLLIICGGMIFFMQSGFAMMCAGSVRLKNVQNTMLKNLLDACGSALAFYLVGTY